MIETEHLHVKEILLSLLWAVLSGGLIPGRMAQSGQDSIAGVGARDPSTSVSGDGANDYVAVDYLLPEQMRRLGTHVTYVTARRPTRITAEGLR